MQKQTYLTLAALTAGSLALPSIASAALTADADFAAPSNIEDQQVEPLGNSVSEFQALAGLQVVDFEEGDGAFTEPDDNNDTRSTDIILTTGDTANVTFTQTGDGIGGDDPRVIVDGNTSPPNPTSGTNRLGGFGPFTTGETTQSLIVDFDQNLTSLGIVFLSDEGRGSYTASATFNLQSGAIVTVGPESVGGVPATADDTFVGFISQADPITSATFTASLPVATGGQVFVTLDDLAFTVAPDVIPEPASLALLGLGGLLLLPRRKRA